MFYIVRFKSGFGRCNAKGYHSESVLERFNLLLSLLARPTFQQLAKFVISATNSLRSWRRNWLLESLLRVRDPAILRRRVFHLIE